LGCSSGFAQAEPASDFRLTANLSAFTDYIFRGVSNSDHGPVAQAGGKLEHTPSGLYASVWGSNVDFKPWFKTGGDPDFEIDLSAGWAKSIAGVNLDLGVVHYDYPGGSRAFQLDYEEYYLGLGYSIKDLALGAKYFYSPDFTGSVTNDSASYIDLTAEYPLPYDMKISGHYGHSFGSYFEKALDLNGNAIDHYGDYRIGISKAIEGIVVSLNWSGVDSSGQDWQEAGGTRGLARNQVVLGISKDFP
jgi:uncharacterized protein (TIGR02001 family)